MSKVKRFWQVIIIFADTINYYRTTAIYLINVETKKINQLKIVLVEQGETEKWLAELLEKTRQPFHASAPMRPDPH